MANETVTTEMNRRIQDVVKDKKVGRAIVFFVSHANEEGYINHSRNGADGVRAVSPSFLPSSYLLRQLIRFIQVFTSIFGSTLLEFLQQRESSLFFLACGACMDAEEQREELMAYSP